MPVSLPVTTTSLGNKVIIVLSTAPASPAAPTKAELNAGLFAQCHVYGLPNAQPTQNVGSAPKKLCAKIEEDRLGTTKFPAFEVQYSYIPQKTTTPGSAGNELYEKLVPGTTRYVYILDGLDGQATSALATADVVNHGFKVTVGEQREGQTGEGDFDEFSTTQTLAPVGGRLNHNYATPAS